MKSTYIVHIKGLSNNFFLIISNIEGKVVLSKSAGHVGFNNIKKRTKESLSKLLTFGIKYLFNLGSIFVILKIEGIFKNYIRIINSQFLNILIKSNKVYIRKLKIVNKISFNGCRKSKKNL